MKNKKALSQVVTSVIMIVLILIAVAVVWTVVQNLIDRGKQQINLGSDCLDVGIKITKAKCNGAGNCNVTINRKVGGDEIGGLKLIFTDASKENSFPYEISGDMEVLATKTEKGIATGIESVKEIELVVYFLNEAEEELLCKETTKFSL